LSYETNRAGRLSARLLLSCATLALTIGGFAVTTAQAAGELPANVLISADECERNRAAGTITYISGYGYSASAGQVDVFLAKELGISMRSAFPSTSMRQAATASCWCPRARRSSLRWARRLT
jgi:hypothetical protein